MNHIAINDHCDNIAAKTINLTVGFHNQIVLHEMNTVFKKNSITTLIGKSGCGKTTFLRSLNRLNEVYEGAKTQGIIKLDLGDGLVPVFNSDQKVKFNLPFLRQNAGMLFQTPQLLPVSIDRNISMPLQLVAHIPKKAIEEKVYHALQAVGLWDEVKDRLNKPVHHLSGGQQQRLCLARLIALEPKILLLDEPTSALDIYAAEIIEQLILTLKQDYSIIMVSHSLQQTSQLSDAIYLFHPDRTVTYFDQSCDIDPDHLKNYF